MKPPSFRYARPESLDEALALGGEYGGDAKLLAGGQSLVPLLNLRFAEPRVLIDNNASDTFTVIEVNGRDRPGFLHVVTRALTRMNLQIASAHITTYGERAVDVFYVKDLFGLKVVNQDKLKQVADTVEKSIRDFDTRFEPVAKAAE